MIRYGFSGNRKRAVKHNTIASRTYLLSASLPLLTCNQHIVKSIRFLLKQFFSTCGCNKQKICYRCMRLPTATLVKALNFKFTCGTFENRNEHIKLHVVYVICNGLEVTLISTHRENDVNMADLTVLDEPTTSNLA